MRKRVLLEAGLSAAALLDAVGVTEYQRRSPQERPIRTDPRLSDLARIETAGDRRWLRAEKRLAAWTGRRA